MSGLREAAKAKKGRIRPEVERLKRDAAVPDKTRKEDLARLNVEIPKDDLKRLKTLAVDQERPLAEVVRTLITNHLKIHK